MLENDLVKENVSLKIDSASAVDLMAKAVMILISAHSPRWSSGPKAMLGSEKCPC